MTYPCEWNGSTEPDDESGVATFIIEGTKYRLHLETFVAFQNVSIMLDAAFKQGKVFAAQAMRSHVENSLDKAERDHGLT